MSTAWGTATFFFEEVETTVGKKKFAVAKKKVAVAKKNFTPLLHKGVKSFFGAQRNAFSLTSSTLKVSKNAERCGTKIGSYDGKISSNFGAKIQKCLKVYFWNFWNQKW